jgi:antirestriction protein ArdC
MHTLNTKVQELITASGAKVYNFSEYKHAFGSASLWYNEMIGSPGVYDTNKDVIAITENGSPIDKDYVWLHELVHWSGNKGRLERNEIVRAVDANITRYLPTPEQHATEEMIAHIGAYHIAIAFGFDIVQTIAYRDMFPNLIRISDMDKAENEGRRAAEWLLNFLQMKLAA